MSRNRVTVQESIFIDKPKERVWDFTQNYALRMQWDKNVLATELLETEPHRKIKLKLRGRSSLVFVYKLDDRPNKTTLATEDVNSRFMVGAGGYWTYTDQEGGTFWTQSNTVIFKNHWLFSLLLPLLKLLLDRQTRKAMRKAKWLIEHAG
jgi:hypothetical protein